MRAFLKFLINLALIAGVIRLVVRFTTIDDKIIEFFTKKSSGNTSTSCTTPWGAKIPDGSSIFAYATPTAGNGECTEELRTCKNTVLGGTYQYPSCLGGNTGNTGSENNGTGSGISPTGAACTTPWGQTIAHGNYIVAYVSPSSCTFQRRMCVDGKLLGKFMYNYCMLAYASAGAANAGGSYAGQGGYNSPYSVDTATIGAGYPQGGTNLHGMSPEEFSNSINDGSPYASWQYTPVQYGGNIANQQLPDDYWNQSANGKTSFIRSWNDTKVNPLATQGTPSNYKGVKDWNYNNYDLTQKGCKTPWGSFVDNGQYVIAYNASTATKGGSCEYERRTCFNGKLNGSFSHPSCSFQGKKTYTTYTQQYDNHGYDNYYWEPTPPTNTTASCRTPRGGRIANGDYIRAYKYASAPWSDGCEGEIRYCHNGVLDGSYGNKSCNLKEPTYPGCYGRQCGNNDRHNSCSLPRGGSIAHGQSVVAYNGSYGNCYSETRTCSNGRLQGSYTSQSCSSSSQGCALPWGGSIGNGQAVDAYATSTSPCLKESRQCINGVLQGSYTVQSCYLQPNPSVDSYGDWEDMGWLDTVPNAADTCHGDGIATFSCQAQDETSCVDYRKVATECCGGTKGRYEKRSVTCVR